MQYNVYQARLNKDQRNAVNTNGWDGHWAYADLSMINQKNAAERVKAGLGYYKHQWVLTEHDLSSVFETLNTTYAADWRGTNARSASVGDIVIEGLSGIGYVCCLFGWELLPTSLVKELQATIVTTIPNLSAA